MYSDYQVVVTGAESLIGVGIIKEFLNRGATVIGVGKTPSEIKDTFGEKYISVENDISTEKQVVELFHIVDERFSGKLDVLVNSCPDNAPADINKISVSEFDEAAHKMLLSPMLLTKQAVPYLLKSHNPSICHIASVKAYLAMTFEQEHFLESALHLALVNYSCQSAAMLGPIRVNAICAGYITDKPDDDAIPKEVIEKIPSGRLGRPEDVAKVVAYLD